MNPVQGVVILVMIIAVVLMGGHWLFRLLFDGRKR